MPKNSEIIVKDMGAPAFTVYDYTPDQADLLRVYEFRTAAAVGREFHSRKAGELHRQLATLDAISTLTSSGAFVSLAFWKSAVGSTVLAVLVFIVALAGILMFLDLDQLLATARRSGAITEQVRIEMDFLCHRFQRVESMDNIRGAPMELKEIQASVESQLRPESQWLPPA